MIRKLIISATFIFIAFTSAWGQTPKKSMTIDDVVKWNRITEREISPDGSHIAVKVEPWKGSASVKLYNDSGAELLSSDSSSTLSFDKNSDYLVFKRGSGKNSTLRIFSLKDRSLRVIEDVKSYMLPEDWSGQFLYQKGDSTLVIESLDSKRRVVVGKASDFAVSPKEISTLFTNDGAVLLYSTYGEAADTIWKGKGKVSRLAISDDASRCSFISDNRLYAKADKGSVNEIANEVSDKRDIIFSPDGSRLYYGIAQEKRLRDTSFKKEDFPGVHIWHWKEKRQFTQQVVNKKRDSEMSFLAVYTFEKGDSYQITNDFIHETRLVQKGNSPIVVGLSDVNYRLEQMWQGRSKYDLFVINTFLERSAFVKEGIEGQVRVSPTGKFLYWYNSPDSAWFTCLLETLEVVKVTDPKSIRAYDMDNDVPDWPSSYSISGWSRGDKYILINDKYDIWRVDPLAKESPVNITQNGWKKRITYRSAISADSDSIDMSKAILLTGFDNTTKGYGYYSLIPANGKEPITLYSGDFMLNEPVKAKKRERFIFTKESFEEFPDIHITDSKFRKIKKITDVNPQKGEFVWGSAKIIKWISYDGVELEGVLYLPENFNPSAKYPMIVNFYDKNSSNLHSHRTPEAHRSTIDYHMYNSNGYVIFNPDIVYKEGYPGESAFNCVMPGISAVLNMGFVDPARVGAQGHSWGGYQVAYLATRTTLFAAIESGAPVVNMFSAYGGIRWGTGLNRSFQYEHQQSRIGKTPWESPLRYIENSPLFTMDKVTTPILIMHNDQDGHVPWYQGIEYFVALKRLQKPVWLLNYTGEIHWPQKLSNKVDFQIRMMQFFNHYLKGDPMPKWMDEGLSAIDLDFETGY
ncbi:MAG: prolyl oligopeptidase family serine peptidase [Bacteroidales bacterium]|nr:prolyl oligopeptidase family serine peptidase [Bacteroidales bacterium]